MNIAIVIIFIWLALLTWYCLEMSFRFGNLVEGVNKAVRAMAEDLHWLNVRTDEKLQGKLDRHVTSNEMP